MLGRSAEDFFIFLNNGRILLSSLANSEQWRQETDLNTLCQSDPLEFFDGLRK
jgi:hypothetical protein